ncbi:MAG: DUF4212 domain-containing protein [Rhodoferax sp.]|uniref:DUF4212 domain-containing protein n=1 Tax=Rhodoferax sp. TaxID=50421 RepID=UPI002ACDE327|nr:DUF4212 domain-containing protein [Rhodoferax sp.]MDZ7893423.1 DUF4212 domain-containing protein [Rhodoferax sp.]
MSRDKSADGYWKATIGLLTKIMIVWFVCSFGLGILFADAINGIKLGGYPLGFFFAQQGSIYVFIALIFYYGKKMGDIDREFDVHEE